MPNYSEAKKRSIFNKYEGKCAYCGCKLSFNSMTIDHIVPKANNGNGSINNLNPACKSCNKLKGDLTIKAFSKLVREQVAEGKFTLHFCATNPKNVLFYRYLEIEQGYKPYVAEDNTATQNCNTDNAHMMSDILENRTEAFIAQFCSDYNLEYSLFMAFHFPSCSSIQSVIQESLQLIDNTEKLIDVVSTILAYDISMINNPKLLELEEVLLKNIPAITPIELLRIENIFILGFSCKKHQEASVNIIQ